MAENRQEVIIAGSGAAGMLAALTLAKAGVPCVVLEKGTSIACSNAARAGGPSLAGTRLQREAGCLVEEEQLFRHMYRHSRGTVDAALLRNIVNEGSRVEELLLSGGIEMEVLEDSYGVGFRARQFMTTDIKDRWKRLQAALEAAGGRVELGVSVEELILEEGRVTGVRTVNQATGEKEDRYGAAVLIATGGYLGNPEMMREHFGEVTIGALGSPLSDGTGIKLVLSAGGRLEKNWGICANEFGGYNHKAKQRFSYSMRFAICGGLLVDRRGRRFMNEQYMSDQPLSLGGEMTLRAGVYYAVLDRAMYEGILRAQTLYEYYGRPEDWYVGKTTHDRPAPGQENMEQAIKEGYALRCDTLNEAAETWGLTELKQSVEAYNRACEMQKDERFGKASFLLKPVKQAPFYVFEYEPSAWCTLGGVRTDDRCRALTAAYDVIPGLYVAGVDNGSCYCAPYYDTEGACLGVAFGSGIVAAEAIREDLELKSYS